MKSEVIIIALLVVTIGFSLRRIIVNEPYCSADSQCKSDERCQKASIGSSDGFCVKK